MRLYSWLFSPFILPPVFLFLSVISFYRIIKLRRTQYRFKQGWLVVRSGVLFRVEKSFELVHFQSATIIQPLIYQMTRNGKLVLEFDKNRKVILTGLGPISELYEIRDKLNNLQRLLRANPLVRSGIIT